MIGRLTFNRPAGSGGETLMAATAATGELAAESWIGPTSTGQLAAPFPSHAGRAAKAAHSTTNALLQMQWNHHRIIPLARHSASNLAISPEATGRPASVSWRTYSLARTRAPARKLSCPRATGAGKPGSCRRRRHLALATSSPKLACGQKSWGHLERRNPLRSGGRNECWNEPKSNQFANKSMAANWKQQLANSNRSQTIGMLAIWISNDGSRKLKRLCIRCGEWFPPKSCAIRSF